MCCDLQAGYLNAEGRLIERYFKNKSKQHILVVGSGNGREARQICHYDCQIICLDISSLYLKAGRSIEILSLKKNFQYMKDGEDTKLPV